ncbi:MAG: hypothetical protein NVSMB7_04300 [Chitinophagaceae bacterium]
MSPLGIHNWQKIAATENELDFAPNHIAIAEINNKKVCIGRYNNNLYAFSYQCPHASGIMAKGNIDVAGNIVCPMHCYKFSLQNGRNTSGEGYYLQHWPVEKREDGIYVGL